MKRIAIVLLVVFVSFGMLTGCGRKGGRLNSGQGANVNLVVLTLDGDLPGQTPDQVAALESVINWMDRDIIKQLKRAGFNASLIKNKSEYSKNDGNLLVVDVDRYNPGSAALRIMVGFGAGAASLDLDYKLYNPQGVMIYDWKDGVGSSRGSNYCAQTLNLHAKEKLVSYFNK